MQLEGVDETDSKILEIIKDNARLGYTEIAEQVGISRISVKNRMKAMEQKGIIKGYQTIIDETSSPTGAMFYMDVETQPEYYEPVLERLSYESRIRKIYTTTGKCKIHAVGYASNTQDAGYFMRTLFGNGRGIVRLTWDILASVVKDVDGGVEYERIKREESEEKDTNEPENNNDCGGNESST